MTLKRHRAPPRAYLFGSMAAMGLVAGVRTGDADRKDYEGGEKFLHRRSTAAAPWSEAPVVPPSRSESRSTVSLK